MLEVVLEETSGPRRKIILRGESLPSTKEDLPVIGGTAVRGKVNYPPGNVQADVALTSATWLPTTFQGRWYDRALWDDRNAPTLIGFDGIGAIPSTPRNTRDPSTAASAATGFGGKARRAMQIVRAFQTLCRSLQVLKFTWGELSYYGILREFSPRWRIAEDITWEARFEWTGDTLAPTKIRTAKRIEPAGLYTLVKNALDTVKLAYDRLSVPARLYAQLVKPAMDALALAVEELLGKLQKLVIGALQPTSIIDDLRAAFLRAQLAAQTLARNVTAALPPFKEPLGPRDSANASLAVLQISREAERMAGVMAERERELSAMQVPEIIAAVPLGFRDLRDLAVEFYGDAADWVRILQYNAFTSSNLPPETIVLIPAKT
jgi:hypothetical protein